MQYTREVDLDKITEAEKQKVISQITWEDIINSNPEITAFSKKEKYTVYKTDAISGEKIKFLITIPHALRKIGNQWVFNRSFLGKGCFGRVKRCDLIVDLNAHVNLNDELLENLRPGVQQIAKKKIISNVYRPSLVKECALAWLAASNAFLNPADATENDIKEADYFYRIAIISKKSRYALKQGDPKFDPNNAITPEEQKLYDEFCDRYIKIQDENKAEFLIPLIKGTTLCYNVFYPEKNFFENAKVAVDYVFRMLQLSRLGINHGDATPRNFIVSEEKGLIPIDFGRASVHLYFLQNITAETFQGNFFSSKISIDDSLLDCSANPVMQKALDRDLYNTDIIKTNFASVIRAFVFLLTPERYTNDFYLIAKYYDHNEIVLEFINKAKDFNTAIENVNNWHDEKRYEKVQRAAEELRDFLNKNEQTLKNIKVDRHALDEFFNANFIDKIDCCEEMKAFLSKPLSRYNHDMLNREVDRFIGNLLVNYDFMKACAKEDVEKEEKVQCITSILNCAKEIRSNIEKEKKLEESLKPYYVSKLKKLIAKFLYLISEFLGKSSILWISRDWLEKSHKAIESAKIVDAVKMGVDNSVVRLNADINSISEKKLEHK